MKKMRFLALLPMIFSFMLMKAETEVTLQCLEPELYEGVTYQDVVVSATIGGSINSLTMDIVMPSGYQYDGVKVASEGILQQFTSGRGGGWSDAWNISPVANENGGSVRFVCSPKDLSNTRLQAGQSGELMVVSFIRTGSVDSDEFYFNGIGAAYQEIGADAVKEPVKYQIGKLGKNGYSSYGCVAQTCIIKGATAYYGVVGGDANDVVSLVPATDNAIFYNNGAVLKGKEGDPIYAISIQDAEEPAKNDLVACATATKVSNVHVLSTDEDGVTGFYLYSGIVPACKAYLAGASTGAPLRVVIEDVNGIEEISAEDLDGVIFNLNGQKVNEVKKGIHIVNGKKVMF